jgi:hypothetical protein
MTALAILALCRAHGVELVPDGGRLLLRARKLRVTSFVNLFEVASSSCWQRCEAPPRPRPRASCYRPIGLARSGNMTGKAGR